MGRGHSNAEAILYGPASPRGTGASFQEAVAAQPMQFGNDDYALSATLVALREEKNESAEKALRNICSALHVEEFPPSDETIEHQRELLLDWIEAEEGEESEPWIEIEDKEDRQAIRYALSFRAIGHPDRVEREEAQRAFSLLTEGQSLDDFLELGSGSVRPVR